MMMVVTLSCNLQLGRGGPLHWNDNVYWQFVIWLTLSSYLITASDFMMMAIGPSDTVSGDRLWREWGRHQNPLLGIKPILYISCPCVYFLELSHKFRNIWRNLPRFKNLITHHDSKPKHALKHGRGSLRIMWIFHEISLTALVLSTFLSD